MSSYMTLDTPYTSESASYITVDPDNSYQQTDMLEGDSCYSVVTVR